MAYSAAMESTEPPALTDVGDLKKAINDDPARRARVDAMKQAMRAGMALGKLREGRGLVQGSVAEMLGVSQANVSRIEHERDPYLSTLSRYVEALGGRLDLLAVFPDGAFRLALPGEEGA